LPLFPNIFNPNAKVLNIFQNKEFYGQDLPISCFFCTFKRKNMALFKEYKNHPEVVVQTAPKLGLNFTYGLNSETNKFDLKK
jgi:hypothetical protein